MTFEQPAYKKLVTAVTIYVASWERCYINYGTVRKQLFDWFMDSEDVVELNDIDLICRAERLLIGSRISERMCGYDIHEIMQETKINVPILRVAFLEVLHNEYVRANRLYTRSTNRGSTGEIADSIMAGQCSGSETVTAELFKLAVTAGMPT
jgi:hypothetical protein